MNPNPPGDILSDRLAGVLLGTAVGDALGLPSENLSPVKIRKRWPGQWKMRFVFGKGMVSDDTEHTLMVARALREQPDDARRFQCALAGKFRWWLAALPVGVGLATARACLKLWLGFPADKSAVVSAGSGPAMRSAIIGAFFATEPERRKAFVLASARLTHQGWQAETAAWAVAEVTALAITNQHGDAARIWAVLAGLSPESEWQKLVTNLQDSLAAGHSVSEFARVLHLERGVTGYALHVVPVALYAWLRHPGDFRTALTSALDCGGDTDTVGAIVGALSGAALGKTAIPQEWREGLWEWPQSVAYMTTLAGSLAELKTSGRRAVPINYFWPAVLVRNVVFLGVVLVHGIRRLGPPYGNGGIKRGAWVGRSTGT